MIDSTWQPACWQPNNFQFSVPRSELALNSQVSLVVSGDGLSAYLKSGSEQAVLTSGRELFSFGSGSWNDGTDATQTMGDSSGAWLKCHVDFSSMIILEKKKIPAHLSELACLDQAVPLKEVLMALEDQGEVSLMILKSFSCVKFVSYQNSQSL